MLHGTRLYPLFAVFALACESGDDDPNSNPGAGGTGGAASGGTNSGGTSSGGTGGSAGSVVGGTGGGAPSGWPGPTNTGVPPGTNLTPYGGPCLITVDGTVIDSKSVDCDLEIHAADVLIKNSNIQGLVFLDADLPGANQWSFTLEDSEVDGGPVQRAAVSDGNLTVLRCNIHGGQTGVHCSENAVSCTIKDSWLHGQYLPDDEPWHLGGFQSNGGTNIVIQHNNIVCDHAQNSLGEGCTGDLNLIPDFAVVTQAVIDGNFFGANVDSSYCTYGGDKSTSQWPHADHVKYTNNVFQRGVNQLCGAYGPVTGFDIAGDGNEWSNNTWEDDGSAVDPAL